MHRSFPTFSPAAGSLAASATFAVGFLSKPLGGIIFSHYGGKIGRKPVLVVTLMLMGVSASPFFWKLDTPETRVIWLAIVVGLSFGVASISGSIAAFYSELFDTRIRYTGLIFAKEVSGAVIGGFTPLFATSLVLWSGGRSWPVSIYMIVTALTASLCAYLVGDIAEQGQRTTIAAANRDALAGARRSYERR